MNLKSAFNPPLEENRVIPKIWELPTRKTFFNWILDKELKNYVKWYLNK